MIRRVSASAASSDARSFAADDRSRRLHDRERSVETRRRELLTAIMALVYCCTKSCDACGRSAEHFYTIPADNSSAGAISHQNAEIVDRSSASNRPELASAMAPPC
ncbi:hypothetical protein HPB50_013328 [Hyalomma asiaticum]|uniref:Uncharacterized protein n=1 Tax=Hyalomma asiaticum TaxID=266040 RepID=A0ACB7RIF4_HYAAI|nr:hypothetical protein HPB50_013328 [Hyalomma asiaticum]